MNFLLAFELGASFGRRFLMADLLDELQVDLKCPLLKFRASLETKMYR